MFKTITDVVLLFILPSCVYSKGKIDTRRPNTIYIIVDQWRAQATNYAMVKQIQCF